MKINDTLINLVRRRIDLDVTIGKLVQESVNMDDMGIIFDNKDLFNNYLNIGIEIDKIIKGNVKLDNLYLNMVISEDKEDYENAIFYRDQILSFT